MHIYTHNNIYIIIIIYYDFNDLKGHPHLAILPAILLETLPAILLNLNMKNSPISSRSIHT